MIDVEIAAHNNLGAALVATIRLETEAEAVRLQPGETARLRLRLTVPPAGLHRWRIGAEGCREGHVRRAHYPHIGRVSRIAPAEIRVLVLDLALPPTRRIGVIEGGSDRVGHWLDELGLGVEPIDDATLRGGDLSRFETILVGIKAFGQKPPLREAAATLRRFVAEGGHLVTLYQRPGDGWTPPAPIEIGSPSIRWRVADPAAPVKVLEPAHSLLSTPNRIVTADWEGWQKERGLYFASRWDEAYEPLIQLSDPGEEPLKGALISGPIGKGRHTHVSLAIHHQLKALVPGAFRLLANLVQPA